MSAAGTVAWSLAASAQTLPSTNPAPPPPLFETVSFNRYAEVLRHCGTYPSLQLVWQRTPELADVSGIYPDPLIASRAVVATGSGLSLTDDAGRSWKPLAQGSAEKIGRVTHITFPLNRPNAFYVATKGRGLWFTSDNGATFQQIASRATGLAHDSIQHIEIYTGDLTGRTLLACHGEVAPGLSRSIDGGRTWQVLFKEFEVHRTHAARTAGQGIYIVAAKASEPEAQALYVAPSLTEPWQQLVRDILCTDFASTLIGGESVLVGTADRGLLRIARGGGVVKRIGPLDVDNWASVGVAWGPTADSQVMYAFDPRKLGMVEIISELKVAAPDSEDEPAPSTQASSPSTQHPALSTQHSRGLYTSAIVREGAHLRHSADGAVFYAVVNSMFYRAVRGQDGVQVADVSLQPAITPFDPISQQNALDQVRESLSAFVRQRNLAEASGPMLEVMRAADQAMGPRRITVQARVKGVGSRPRAVTVDLSRIGLPAESPLLDDGQHDDGAAGDGLYANGFQLNLLTAKRVDKDWRRPWPGILGLTVTATADNGALSGVVAPFSVVNPGGAAPFWDSRYHETGVEEGKVRRATAASVHGGKRAQSLTIETPGPWRVRLCGSRDTLDVAGAVSLAFQVRTTEECTEEVYLHLRDQPAYALPTTTPGVPLLAEGFVPGKKFTTAYQRVVIPLSRLLRDAEEFQPSIVRAIILSGKTTRPMQIILDDVVFSYSHESPEPAKAKP